MGAKVRGDVVRMRGRRAPGRSRGARQVEKPSKLKNNKALGQHWLNNRLILEEIAELAVTDIGEGNHKVELCLEIGPGLGTLTSSLLRRFPRVVAVEYDERLARNLPGSFPGKNLEVVHQDFLTYDLGQIKEPYVVAGNIPYYITSPILAHLLLAENKARRIVLLIQKEVAERIVSEKESMLSLLVKNYATPRLGPVVSRGEFSPPPKVDSQVIILEPHETVAGPEVMKLISAGFLAPRKKLINNLSGLAPREKVIEVLNKIGKSKEARAEELHLEDWKKLAAELS